MFAVVPAFLIEAALYLASGMQTVRTRLEALHPRTLAALLTVSGPLPYFIYTVGLGSFDPRACTAIAAIAATVALWYVVLPRRTGSDLLLLATLAAIQLADVFELLYPRATGRLRVDILGTAMLVRTAMVAVLSIRRLEGVGFGFLPTRRDWAIGAACYAIFVPIGFGIGIATGFFAFANRPLWLLVPTFLGFLWVVALAEEFVFRGILQPALGRMLHNRWAGWILASLLFGAVHLPFRSFPNYRFALLATVAGLFYGWAYMKAQSIRAAMVAHALTATTWRVLLS